MVQSEQALPSGTVTFLFTDIEGSTMRWDRDRDAMQEAVRRHDAILRSAIESNGGRVFKTIGDAFCAAFARAFDAFAATLDAQRAMLAQDWSAVGGLRVRMALHAGVTDERNDDYFGPTVNRVARLLAIGHGGQVLVSAAAKALIEERMPQGTSLIDLGVHRLKDLSAPEQVYRLEAPGLPSDFPPLRSLDFVPNNLPAEITPLLGRENELAEVQALLRASRLVTLAGPGGIGKTRLALQLGADEAKDDGTWFVDLAPCEHADLVASEIGTVLDVADEGGSQKLIDRIATAIRGKSLLLIVDNCEHVIGAAAAAVEVLLKAAPNLRVLSTSREPLGIRGESVYRLPTLSMPPAGAAIDAATIENYGACALFIARARAVAHAFAVDDESARTIADIVRRLDGIALAIELAAARVKVLKLPQLLSRLDDRLKLLTGGSRTALPRQQTLRALIGWSYDLLGDDEKQAFARLSVLRGSWGFEAAEAICEESGIDAFEAVATLVDKSLLVADEAQGDEQRYRFLASIREFATQAAVDAGIWEDAQRAHAALFERLARQVADEYWTIDAEAWNARVLDDLENYRAAMDWALGASGDAAQAATIVSSLRWYWWSMARREGSGLIERVLAALPEDARSDVRGKVALTAATLLVGASGETYATQALDLLGGAGPVVEAEALNVLADTVFDAGKTQQAVEFAERAVSRARAASNPRLLGWVLSSAAYCLSMNGDADRSAAYLEEAEPLLRKGKDLRQLARLQVILGELRFARGDARGALACVREAEAIYRERRSPLWLSVCLLNATAYALALDDLEAARGAVREALQLATERDDAALTAAAIQHIARIAATDGDAELAARLIGFVDAEYARMGGVREPTEQAGYEALLALLRERLSEERLASLLAAGRAMAAEDALEQASPAASGTPGAVAKAAS